MSAAELAEQLERLDALFVELYNYAESQSLSDTMSKSGANALRAIKGSIGNRYNVIPQAASALEALISRSEVMEEDNVYAQEIIAEFKSEVAKLAENDPEFDALQKRRYPDDLYKGSWERGHLKASAKQYRNAAMLALHENIKQRDEIRSLRSALSLKAGKE